MFFLLSIFFFRFFIAEEEYPFCPVCQPEEFRKREQDHHIALIGLGMVVGMGVRRSETEACR
jgi:hypothetical protein